MNPYSKEIFNLVGAINKGLSKKCPQSCFIWIYKDIKFKHICRLGLISLPCSEELEMEIYIPITFVENNKFCVTI
jgi:hypothetical protein